MKKRLLILTIAFMLIFLSACSKHNDEAPSEDISDSVNQIIDNQRIVFIMSVSSYDEPYMEGYFIDTEGKKHCYRFMDRRPFDLIDQEYEFLIEHYEEFETSEFFSEDELRESIECLCLVNSEANRIKKGDIIFDYPYHALYGIRQKDGKEERVWLRSFTGIDESLDDPYANSLYEMFGDSWDYLDFEHSVF